MAVLLVLPGTSSAQGCAPQRSSAPSTGGAIVVTTSQSGLASHAQSAVSNWETTCPGSGTSFPDMAVNQSVPGAVNVSVELISGQAPSGCGMVTTFFNAQGHIASAMMQIYAISAAGFACNHADTIAHELGHVLGIANAGSGCTGQIMGPPSVTSSGRVPRTIGQDACMTAGNFWTTPEENGDGGGCAGQTCGPCVL